jgi:hypothetical protein
MKIFWEKYHPKDQNEAASKNSDPDAEKNKDALND